MTPAAEKATLASDRPLRVVALVKQTPAAEGLAMTGDGRVDRTTAQLEMSAWCRRAVAQGVALASASGGECTVVTMGPPSALDVLREAVAFGADAAVHLCDPRLAGSDTLVTATALAGLLRHLGGSAPWDAVFVGRASLDAETGQVGPQVAELLGLPFVGPAIELGIVDTGSGSGLHVVADHGDELVECRSPLPVVVSTAERLIDPCKVKDVQQWPSVGDHRITVVSADVAGPGPWGADASATWVGETRSVAVARAGRRLVGEPTVVAPVVARWIESLGLALAGEEPGPDRPRPVAPRTDRGDRVRDGAGGGEIVVVVEPSHPVRSRSVIGQAVELAEVIDGFVTELRLDAARTCDDMGRGRPNPSDAAIALEGRVRVRPPWAVLFPASDWTREIAARLAVRLSAGLIGDAVDLDADDDGRLVAWKAAFSGAAQVAVRTRSDVQLVVVRPTGGATRVTGAGGRFATAEVTGEPDDRVRAEQLLVSAHSPVEVRARRRVDDTDALASASVLIGVGRGVDPSGYDLVRELAARLGAELVATRKVTDVGWLPRSRQVGITGLGLAPDLYVALGTSGRFNHLAGVAGAGAILAVDVDPAAPVFDAADLGVVADWAPFVRALLDRLSDSPGSQRQ